MLITSLEDLKVYQDSLDAADAVSALLTRPCFVRDFKLRDQIAEASDKISATISEGYGQLTDRHFCHYLGVARGSCNEIRSHLTVARGRKYLTAPECHAICERYVSIGKRLTKLIQWLRKEDRKQRG